MEVQKIPKSARKRYVAVIIPEEDTNITKDVSQVVFSSRDKHLLLNRNCHARFHNFSAYEDALKFLQSPDSFQIGTPAKIRSPHVKSNDFHTPKPEEVSVAHFYIENQYNEEFSRAVKLNPRLLCTKCEQAPAYHLGTKMNALHVAAKSNNLEAAKIILQTILHISFYELLYPKDNAFTIRERCRLLNASYLNAPDRMLLETPLHYAAKYNSIDVLKLLILHPLCNLDSKNHKGLTPAQIAGTRDCGLDSVERRNEVVQLLENIYILPVWRDVLCASSPRVGIYGKWKSFGNRLPKSFYGPLSHFPTELLPHSDESVHLSTSDDMDSFKISSYAGPMKKEKAEEFYESLKGCVGRKKFSIDSPGILPYCEFAMCYPKDLILPSKPVRSISSEEKADMQIRMEDYAKGLERVCRKYSKLLNVPWKEYWGFLEVYCSLESRDGLDLLENFLVNKAFINVDLRSKHEDSSGSSTEMSPREKRRKCDIVIPFSDNNGDLEINERFSDLCKRACLKGKFGN